MNPTSPPQPPISPVRPPLLTSLRKTIGPRLGTLFPTLSFNSLGYLRHTARRLEHLASLRIPVAGRSVLEVGAGIGDHSHYYLDRGCRVTITEVRPSNLRLLGRRFPGADIRLLDIEHPPASLAGSPWDVVHCYGLLYHLKDPEGALRFMSAQCGEMLLLETCVSFGQDEAIHSLAEPQASPTQAFSGRGCRPTRSWIHTQLRRHFAHVYLPLTQPNHAEFPLNWDVPEEHQAELSRAVFVATRSPLANEMLTQEFISRQKRHE